MYNPIIIVVHSKIFYNNGIECNCVGWGSYTKLRASLLQLLLGSKVAGMATLLLATVGGSGW